MMAALLFGTLSVYACTCAEPSVREKFRRADVIFVGELVGLAFVNPSITQYVFSIQFIVEKYWKGAAGRELKVLFKFDRPGWCGDLPLTKGERYLIYADQGKEGLNTYVDCGPNRIAKHVPEELKKLDGLRFRMFARLFPYPKF